MSDHILKVENLAANYGDFIAVQSADLSVSRGQIVSIIGANGAGKSTLVNCIAGIHKSTQGEIYFKGENITNLPPEKIVAMGLSLVPESGRCFSRMTVQDNLLMGSFPKRARKSYKDSLEYVYTLFPDLKEKYLEPAGVLSGGQRQMVAIGRALMAQPECVIFDEISLGLSPAIIKDIYKTIRHINEISGTSIVLIEGDSKRVVKYSDSLYVMLKGKTVLHCSTDNVDHDAIKKAYMGI